MIFSTFGSLFKKTKNKWLIRQEERLQNKFYIELEDIQKAIDEKRESLVKSDRDVSDLLERSETKKLELEKMNVELREQIKLIEAKARPDSIWANAFSLGFSKAWDMALPVMMDGFEKVKESIKEKEIDNSIPRLNEMVKERIKELKEYHLEDLQELYAKKQDLKIRLTRTHDNDEKVKYNHYIQAIDWMLKATKQNGN